MNKKSNVVVRSIRDVFRAYYKTMGVEVASARLDPSGGVIIYFKKETRPHGLAKVWHSARSVEDVSKIIFEKGGK